MSSSTTFRPIGDIPADRRDGRPMLIRHGLRSSERRARFSKGGEAWVDTETGGVLLAVQAWTDVSAAD